MYPLANCEHVGIEDEMLNVSTNNSDLGDNVSQDVFEWVSSRGWELQECKVHENSNKDTDITFSRRAQKAYWIDEVEINDDQ